MLALQVSILLTVFGFGLRATTADVLYLVRRPSLLGRSLLSMFVVMPILAAVVARAFTLPHTAEIVLVSLAISPIPPLLPGRERRLGGNPSYGLGLMAIAAMLSIVVVPLAAQLVGWYFMKPFAMSSRAIAAIVLKAVVLPLAAGMALHAMWPDVVVRILKPVALVAQVLLAIGVLAILSGALPAVIALIGDGVLLVLAAFIVAGLAVGHALGGPDADNRLVLALSTASRHPAIALAVAKANFPDEPHLGATILLYLLVNALLGIPLKAWQQRRHAVPA